MRPLPRITTLCLIAAALFPAAARDLPESLPQLPFHLTARPWRPLNVTRKDYLDAIEGICRFTVRQQDAHGAVIDPIQHRELQYSTPYFAFAVGTLIHEGRAIDLLDNGIRAMDHATECFGKGREGIPDQHSEFFIAPVTEALELYKSHVPAEKIALWQDRVRTPPIAQLLGGNKNNWRAYAMKGEWLRAKAGLVSRDEALAFIEDGWLHAEQKARIATDKWNLYEDGGTNPESHAVEAVGRGNLLALVASGYDGPSAAEMQQYVERGTAVSLLLQDPSGQCPPDGRADDHVWNDVLYQLCFEVMAERAAARGDMTLAGQYRHAAMSSFQSIQYWKRENAPWTGSYYITKNHFDPAQRVGYQRASNYMVYNGAVMMHLAEAVLTRKTDIPEKPSPTEIGGYAFAMDEKFASVVANAGGMQMFAAMHGQVKKEFDRYWTSLGVERFARAGWDSRLGPSDGVRDIESGRGVTFAPTWLEDGKWVRMADMPDKYRGKFSVQFVHPLLVRCAIDYTPVKGDGPSFRHEFIITPDGVLATLHATGVDEFGVTLPLLENDGAPLQAKVSGMVATTCYRGNWDQQSFLALDDGTKITNDEERIQSTYGWLRPIRATAVNGVNHTFIYPRNGDSFRAELPLKPADPAAEKVRGSFHITPDGFASEIGSVHGTIYTGRTSAGGEGTDIDCDGDGKPDAVFGVSCKFILQLRDGRILAVESDRKTSVVIQGKTFQLAPYIPLTVNP